MGPRPVDRFLTENPARDRRPQQISPVAPAQGIFDFSVTPLMACSSSPILLLLLFLFFCLMMIIATPSSTLFTAMMCLRPLVVDLGALLVAWCHQTALSLLFPASPDLFDLLHLSNRHDDRAPPLPILQPRNLLKALASSARPRLARLSSLGGDGGRGGVGARGNGGR